LAWRSVKALLISIVLVVGSGVIVTCTRWKRDTRAWAAVLGFSTAVLAAVVILVVAFFFGAGLRCGD
jgi:F0F1-type ATP synthase assembly protein I